LSKYFAIVVPMPIVAILETARIDQRPQRILLAGYLPKLAPMKRQLITATLISFSGIISVTPTLSTLADSVGVDQPSRSAQSNNFVLKIHHSRCAECGFFEATIAADGRYEVVADPGKAGNVPIRRLQGKVSQKDVRQIQQQIAKTNFQQIKSMPFKGYCTTEVDGAEATYTFVTRNGLEVIPECTYNIEPKSALFKQADRLYNQISAAYLKPYQPKH
jgi:hypothetical protein